MSHEGKAGVMNARYVVFEDLQSRSAITAQGDTPVKIHRETCRLYLGREAKAKTVHWTESFGNLIDAQAHAMRTGKPWKRADCCP